jgi:hypothetical protein
VTDKREFLAELPLFADLSETSLDAVARITREYAFESGGVIAYQRDVADRLYIVKEGRLFARSIDNNGVARETRSYMPGEAFNDVWLFVPDVHKATVKGAEAGRLLIIEGPEFNQLLKRYPAIIDELAPREEDDTHYGLSDAAWEKAQQLKYRPRVRKSFTGALLPEERVELFTRRSYWFLIGRLVFPILLVLVAAVILVLTPTDPPIARAIKIAAPVVMTLAGLILFVVRLIDFRADYFVITNLHMTHHEFELRQFRIRLVKIPISQVQTVEVLRPSLLANLFNIGSARVTTAAVAGSVLFDNIDDPGAVKDVIQRLTGQYKSLESAQTQAVMRQTIEKHFGIDAPLKPTDEATASAVSPRRRIGFWAAFRRSYGWRVVDGNTITYRKSLFILLRQIALPLLVFVLLGVLIGFGLYLDISNWVVAAIAGIGGFFNLIWFVWQAENWHNDIFQLTDRFVIDFDRLPFGFSESRKQAAINNIQNVDALRPGFFATLFNYGFVNIDTAGAKSEIVFDYVPNPELIQADIFQRIDEANRKQRIQEGSARRQEYALLLDVYRQAMEQERIPQRTPPENDIEET